MIIHIYLLLSFTIFTNIGFCQVSTKNVSVELKRPKKVSQKSDSILFNKAEALHLARLPLRCIHKEFPNSTAHLSDGPVDAVLLPSQLHPTFYGCLDWHSSVHGHWMLVRILKQFPSISIRDSIINLLENSFQDNKIENESAYFSKYSTTKIFERTYGWAWLLKLDEELYTWDNPMAKKWYKTLQPLTRKITELWKEYLLKETYPNRSGVHPNTAFGLVFALDWAKTLNDTTFANSIVKKSKSYYLNNVATPAYLEPDGTDFLSPSLEIADLMRRVLSKQKFIHWINLFYNERDIKRITQLPVISDRKDYKIVHLEGLIISRAWCMKGIAAAIPANHPWKNLFQKTSNTFLKEATLNVASENYGGDHWLASFIVYAFSL